MTRVWSEGFELQDLVGYTASPGISTSVKRSGAASYAGADTYTSSFTKTITAVSEFYLRFAVYLNNNSSTTFYWKKGGTTLGYITINTSGITISCNGLTDTGAYIPIVNSWTLLEVHIKINDTTGVVEIKYEGLLDASVSGDTKPGADTTVDTLYFERFNAGGYYPVLYLDDIGLNNTAGGVDDSWCGDGKIIMLTPNDDVTTELTQYPALTDHHADVDDYPADGDTTYVQGTVVDEEDLYELSASGLVAADVDTINRVWVESRSKDTVASGGEVALFIVSDATEGTGADVVLGTAYSTKVMSQEFLQDPDGPAAWSVAALDALRAGVRTRA